MIIIITDFHFKISLLHWDHFVHRYCHTDSAGTATAQWHNNNGDLHLHDAVLKVSKCRYSSNSLHNPSNCRSTWQTVFHSRMWMAGRHLWIPISFPVICYSICNCSATAQGLPRGDCFLWARLLLNCRDWNNWNQRQGRVRKTLYWKTNMLRVYF